MKAPAKTRTARFVMSIAMATALAASGLTACASTTRCLPAELTASPARIAAGDTLTLASGPAECDLGFESEPIYTVVLYSSTAQQSEPLEVAPGEDGTFSSEISIPESFSPGIATVVVTGSPYDECGNESGSCAQYSVDVTITG
ncbi:hypothetical protein [Microbacterium sp. 1.5R]|uniref:hypothetical protein n=1 Tax=Microbacterium sp. 1.5R TaxID=1916917 RepID=UPI0011AAB9D5|nr:hypothetical protein [Microbacterium sp. 1.5R]